MDTPERLCSRYVCFEGPFVPYGREQKAESSTLAYIHVVVIMYSVRIELWIEWEVLEIYLSKR